MEGLVRSLLGRVPLEIDVFRVWDKGPLFHRGLCLRRDTGRDWVGRWTVLVLRRSEFQCQNY